MKTLRSKTTRIDCSPVPKLPIVVTIAGGNPTTIPAKISKDIPLPTPRSVICSPSHMMKMVPAVSVNTVMSVKARPGLLTKVIPPVSVVFCRKAAMPADCMTLSKTVPYRVY